MPPKPKTWTPEEAEQFKKLCGIFCTKKEICSIMGISDHRTLDSRIKESFPETPTWEEAFDLFSGHGRASLRRKQFELAMNGDKTMLIFLGKNYLAQSDNGLRDEQPKPKANVTEVSQLEVIAKRRSERRKAAEA